MIAGSVTAFFTPSIGAPGESSRLGEGTAFSSVLSDVSVWDMPNAGRVVEILGGRDRGAAEGSSPPREITEGARDRGTGIGDWSRIWSIMCSLVARLRLPRQINISLCNTGTDVNATYLHILHRILRFPYPPTGVGGKLGVGVAGYFAICCVASSSNSPLSTHTNQLHNQTSKKRGPTSNLNGRTFHVPLSDIPVADGSLEFGLIPERELFSERFRGAARAV